MVIMDNRNYVKQSMIEKKVWIFMFKSKMKDIAQKIDSKIVLALDFPFNGLDNQTRLFEKAKKIIEDVYPYICAVKINHHLVLPLGTFHGVKKLIEIIHEKNLLVIMDCKANDIGATNKVIAEYYFSAGFDAIIANPFVGWDEGLKPIFEVAEKMHRGVILLVYMSHKGAKEGYGQLVYNEGKDEKVAQYISFARKALKWGADGVVVGATVPEKIKEIHEILGDKIPIFSPGVGVQGGKAISALNAGSSYLIVGRSITLAENPKNTAKALNEKLIINTQQD
jgi:orotidine-5'-phosphate decarboxylase